MGLGRESRVQEITVRVTNSDLMGRLVEKILTFVLGQNTFPPRRSDIEAWKDDRKRHFLIS